MKKLGLFLTLFVLVHNSFAQGWSESVTIFTGGLNRYPEFTIDNNGVMHCVWALKIQTNYWKILYSKSMDNGLTWSEAEDISKNNDRWMYNPHIIADTNNNIYVSYDYNTGDPNNMLVVMKKFDGMVWSDYDTVSEGLPGSMHNRLAIDHNNQLYCFWYNGMSEGKIFYRTLENGIWSSISQPYMGNDEHLFLNSIIVDDQNNLHCAGAHHYAGQSGYDDRAIYFNLINGVWSNFTVLSNNTTWEGLDVALDTNNNPSVTWGQYTSNSDPPNEGTFVSSFNGSSWSTPQLLVEDHPDEQVISIDKNNFMYIIDNEKGIGIFSQVCYKKLLNEMSIITISQNNSGYYDQVLISSDTLLFLGYIESNSKSNYSIKLRRYSIITDNQKNDPSVDLSISPNPFKNTAEISFSTELCTNLTVKIFNLKGQLVNILLNENKTPGKYSIQWEGNDLNGKEVSSGIYLVRLQAGSNVVTRSVILTK